MTKASGHYSGWVKRTGVSGRFTGPIGQTTTGRGFKVVEFSPPSRVNEGRLAEVLKNPKAAGTSKRGSGS